MATEIETGGDTSSRLALPAGQAEDHTYKGLNLVFIGGRWREGSHGKRMQNRSPWNGELLAEHALANAQDVDEAYAAASQAWLGWWRLPPQQRSQVLERAVALMDQRREEILHWIVWESGGTRSKAETEWLLARNITEEAATFPFRMGGEILPASIPGKESRIYREPAGVVTVISPFNFPWHLSMRSVAPALACGNAVVLKPASDTPISGGTLVGRLFEEAGVPPGLLQVLVGAGSEIGDKIVDHPVPRVVSFTGSTAVGQHLGAICGERVKRVGLELGGNGPMLILDDADIEQAADAAIFGTFSHQGQICMAANRILVARKIFESFVDVFVEKVRGLVVGEVENPRTMIGPIINKRQKDRILDRVLRTKLAGAIPLVEGEPDGLVVPPIVLVGVTNDMPCAKEENFGPVAPLMVFDSEEEGIAIANDTSAGLSAAVFTADAERGALIASRIASGMVHVNDSPVNDEANTAFGGVKQSGIGRFGGKWAMEEFTETKWISVQHQPRSYVGSGGE